MAKGFQRHLTVPFLDQLLGPGPARQVFLACHGAGLDLRWRPEDRVNAYSKGRCIVALGPASMRIHGKYLPDGVLGQAQSTRKGNYLHFDLGKAAAAFCSRLGEICVTAQEYEGREEASEDAFLRGNAGPGPFQCMDRQVQIPGIPGRLDALAVTRWQGRSALVAAEIKCGLDNRIQVVPHQIQKYVAALAPAGGLRQEVAESYGIVATQMRTMGLSAPEPGEFSPGMPVLGLLVLVDYNPASRLLGRARVEAAGLPRPTWLWQGNGSALKAPDPSGWVRL